MLMDEEVARMAGMVMLGGGTLLVFAVILFGVVMWFA